MMPNKVTIDRLNVSTSLALDSIVTEILREFQPILDSLSSEEHKQKIYDRAHEIAKEQLKNRLLKARFSLELMEDLRAFHNIDAEDELAKLSLSEAKKEEDQI